MTIRTRVFAPVLALLALSIAGPAWSDFELNMPVGVTTTSREVYELHMLILWVCVIIGAGVYGAMIVAIVKFRKSKGAVAAKLTHNSTVEVDLDRDSGRDSRRDGRAGRRDADPHGGHARVRAHDQDHGLPMALALRLHRRRRGLLQHARSREQRGAQARLRASTPTPSTITC